MFITSDLPEGADEQTRMAHVRSAMEILAEAYGISDPQITVGVAHADIPGLQSWAWAHMDEYQPAADNVIDIRDYRRVEAAGPGAA